MRTLYRLFISMKWATPSEFWNLMPGEVWWVIEAHTGKTGGQSLSQNEYTGLLGSVRAAQAAERAAMEGV